MNILIAGGTGFIGTYLKKRFDKNMAGEIVYEYNGKLLIKLNDGVIKVYHGHNHGK